ncbi:MAG: hypothetical protein ACI39W_02725 [Brotaphodocola sp.]
MKKYRICFYLFFITSVICVCAGFAATRFAKQQKSKSMETERMPATVEMEEVGIEAQAANQQQIDHKTGQSEEYYLVSENGFLLVFAKDQQSVCLYTHIPLTELPQEEQDRLREGIWFPSMAELFQYLESCTS